MDKMSGWQSGEELLFFAIPIERRGFLYIELSKWFLHEAKCSGSNHELRCVAYYDTKAYRELL